MGTCLVVASCCEGHLPHRAALGYRVERHQPYGGMRAVDASLVTAAHGRHRALPRELARCDTAGVLRKRRLQLWEWIMLSRHRVMVCLMSALLCLGAMGTTALPTAAQEVCQEEPTLAVVDGNKDGVASVEEIRAVAPDNTRLQELTGQLEAQGVTGIRYTGCDESAPASDTDDSLCVVTQDELDAIQDATPTPDVKSLDSRLGGNLDTFTDLFSEDDIFTQEGCSRFSTISYQAASAGDGDIVTVIELWADRDADIEAGTLDKPSDANWSMEEAEVIAAQLVPTDTLLDDPQETDAENLLIPGFSESLAAVTTTEHYTYHASDGTPGDVEVLFGRSSDGTVWNITVQLGGIT